MWNLCHVFFYFYFYDFNDMCLWCHLVDSKWKRSAKLRKKNVGYLNLNILFIWSLYSFSANINLCLVTTAKQDRME